jgi:hypothetical protein
MSATADIPKRRGLGTPSKFLIRGTFSAAGP